MLEKIREGSQGLAAKIILGLVILSFALAGIGGYLGQSTEQSVAEVNGVKITQREFARAYENERARLEQQFGEYFAQLANDPSYMAQVRQSVTDRLVQQELQTQLAAEMGLRVSDEQVKQTILELPAFQFGGQFSNDRYLQVIRQMGYQADGFREYLREEMTRSQLVSALAGTDFTLSNELSQAVGLQQQQRAIDYVVLDNNAYKAQVEVSDEEVQEYYDLNQAQFLSPEQVKVSYVELSADDLELAEPITDEQINDYYQQNKAYYSEPEKRRVAHILVEYGDDQDSAEQKANDLLTQLNNGADFAELASNESDDIVSAEMGGDLDWIERDMLDPDFEKAAFALQNVGELSQVVESEFGYHIIKLTDLQPGETKPLAEVKEDIRTELAKVEKADLFYEQQTELAELSFEVADTLEDAAAAVGAQVQTTPWLARGQLSAPLNEANVQAAIFSPELLEDRVNSEVLDLGNEHVIVVRIADHKPAATKPLAEVSEQIKQTLIAEKATAKAKEQGEELFAQLQSGTSLNAIAQQAGVEMQSEDALNRRSFSVAPALVEQVFKLAHPQDEPVVDMVELNNGNIALVALKSVNTPSETEVNAQVKQNLTMQMANKNYQSFIEALEAQAEVVRMRQQGQSE
ncbi:MULTISPECIES: peptidylprolyl isomerase [Pseudoalteromonas]|uniref:Periplasmic chaperone PpiD n=1 Tax=Pseudoalteromonas ruthenica TaxID=151081 RepID=A0A0F4Q1K8_9GAMM|nr:MULTISPECIES: peptidylprolyl isomerase [Pseudoalteromonas]KJZ00738.1 peptidylprolyl isomerase [Pseudoalteromonas ruthenica]KJZ01209.1 peptidylprolyl isomerase [Pseudoalteromonas ruthenica]MCG7566796.1 peptidylprolyl isomerase [Pseudoalteromonas sp. CnMc7-15]QFU04458.1 Peptidyl-prolyl cis-trans isomerase D [Pseudoalteromonas sp. THAF3]TMO87839.1 peptidylprolyl isomerase [Pseudoalteromonas ruthenica]|tara:strand:- start:21653 stop:23554 length:1902 start_codon:yes stop_codon:yes gene_type:complete